MNEIYHPLASVERAPKCKSPECTRYLTHRDAEGPALGLVDNVRICVSLSGKRSPRMIELLQCPICGARTWRERELDRDGF